MTSATHRYTRTQRAPDHTQKSAARRQEIFTKAAEKIGTKTLTRSQSLRN